MKGNSDLFSNSEAITSINNYAYINREDLTDINLPDNIKRIGERAFSKCSNLKSIILPENLEFIGASAFSDCESLEEITLPRKLKKLNYRTFANCKKLKRIVVPEGIEEIDWAVFSGCENLEEVVLPNSLKTIGKQLFLNCKKLKKVNLPSSISFLPEEFFKGCKNLDIVLPSNITKLGNRVFEDCYKLSTFPSNVTAFGENCFHNCKNLTFANINEEIEILPAGMFDGCTNLSRVSSVKKLTISQRCFRNCTSLTEIPSFIKNYAERAFENCTGLTSINIIDSNIPSACFRGCKNLKEIKGQDKITSMESFAFSGCERLEEFKIYNLETIPSEAFSNCHRLKNIYLSDTVKAIDSRAFYKCQSLTNINLPNSIKTVKKEAFRECNCISVIVIPSSLEFIGDGAFSYMNSLETIYVNPLNPTFITPDNKILINRNSQELALYASGAKDKTYSLENYNLQYDDAGNESAITPLKSIGPFAFAGAENLEELTICSCTINIDITAFDGCKKIKKLNIKMVDFFRELDFIIKNHSQDYQKRLTKYKLPIPFEEIKINGETTGIRRNAFENFTQVKKLILSEYNPYSIAENAFYDCTQLKEVTIPSNVNTIRTNAFNPNTKLKFSNGLEITDLIKFFQVTDANKYRRQYKLYVLNNDVYYIEEKDKITMLTEKQIEQTITNPSVIKDDPVLFYDFMCDLIKHDLAIPILLNGILIANMSLDNRTILLNSFKKDDTFFLKVLENSKLLENNDQNTRKILSDQNFSLFVNYVTLLRKYNITSPMYHSKFFIANLDVKIFEELIKTDFELFEKIIIYSGLLEVDKSSKNSQDQETKYHLTYKILEQDTLLSFMKLIKKYNIKDKYLYNKTFIVSAKNPLFEKMLKIYDANTKRVLKASEVTNENTSSIQNFSDLLILMKITGALEENQITRQRADSFISEKIFADKLAKNRENQYRIIGDDIHRIFNFPYTRDEFDQEFANFFLENYHELYEEEKNKSGFIQRVYVNFRSISETCTSNKGAQRKLKVTIKKCQSYLLHIKFSNVNKENEELANLISKWYDDDSDWLKALTIYQESLKAPRNIFTKIETNEEGQKIYDNDPSHDLKEEINPNFSFEWLPKQDYDNLILGKYCNCCAHISGAGQGIMRASMILDCCQNLVIRNEQGKIIAKSTLYVNREQGYAVFNNVEASLNYRDDKSIAKIYKAFLKGSVAFMEAYNKYNEDNPLTNISIGANRNTILKFLTDENHHPQVPIQASLNFGTYSLSGNGYGGDWRDSQRLVLKKGSYQYV